MEVCSALIFGAHLLPGWEGYQLGGCALPGPRLRPVELATFLQEVVGDGQGLVLLPPEGISLHDVALARSLAGLSGRLRLRSLRASGLAASWIALQCLRAAGLRADGRELLALALDRRVPWALIGRGPAPAWLAPHPPLACLPLLWWCARPGRPLRLCPSPPPPPAEDGWEAAARGGLPPSWWPGSSHRLLWRDQPADAFRGHWVSLARPLSDGELAPLLARLQAAVEGGQEGGDALR